jgi:protoporphyrinogen oxidase
MTAASAHGGICVLGGGPAGLAVGYYARQAGLACTVYEGSSRSGGNCVTFREGDFLFDSGAHRFHDKDEEITRDVKELLGDDLVLIEVPSYIHSRGKLIDFPLSPLNLLARTGPLDFTRAGLQVLAGRLGRGAAPASFEELALRRYGRLLAERFLLGYSEKLWGLPCSRLSPDVAGKRLHGLDLRTFVAEAIGGVLAKDRHVDGRFYYPRHGYGQIADALAASCGDTLRLGSRVTRVVHDGRRIVALEVGGTSVETPGTVVSTLPLALFAAMLSPAPPQEILDLARAARHRHVVLAAFFLGKSSVGDAGTVYFPDADVPFTRVYEPRNRSPLMAPAGSTSLVAEIPCAQDDDVWRASDEDILELVRGRLEALQWLDSATILGQAVRRLPFAYPVMEAGYEKGVERVHRHLESLSNLRFSGRNGLFRYSWLHEMLRFGKDIVADCRLGA